MTKLSIQEITYLRNPENFNPGYQRVLSHRINKKVKQSETLLNYVDKYKRAMITQGKRTQYDKDQQLLQLLKENTKNRPITVFTPNVRERARQIETDINKLSNKIKKFSYALKDMNMNENQKEEASMYISGLEKKIDYQFNELKAIFKIDNELIE